MRLKIECRMELNWKINLSETRSLIPGECAVVFVFILHYIPCNLTTWILIVNQVIVKVITVLVLAFLQFEVLWAFLIRLK